MLTASDTIRGWSPVGDEDVEIDVSHDLCFTTLNPITSSSAFLNPLCPPLPKVYPPPHRTAPLPSSTGIARTPIAPSSDRRAHRNRNRDPSWIPRPRNAFIIFRCEYSREHAQGPQESQDDPVLNTITKTLSKRAAEAWKRLPPSERERYKTLADREREEHARLYPHYRFRPMKRQSGTSRSSCERPRSPKVSPLQGHPAPSTPAVTIPPETLHCDDPAFDLDFTHEDSDRAQALEAYAIGLYNYDLLSPFSFPEYC